MEQHGRRGPGHQHHVATVFEGDCLRQWCKAQVFSWLLLNRLHCGPGPTLTGSGPLRHKSCTPGGQTGKVSLTAMKPDKTHLNMVFWATRPLECRWPTSDKVAVKISTNYNVDLHLPATVVKSGFDYLIKRMNPGDNIMMDKRFNMQNLSELKTNFE